jgi:hypothetical protein
MAFRRPATHVIGLAAVSAAVIGIAWARSASFMAFSAQPTKPAEIVAALQDMGCTVIIDRGGPLSALAKSGDRYCDESLLESLKLPRLTHLIHFQTSIAPAGLKTLQASRPALRVIEHQPWDGC